MERLNPDEIIAAAETLLKEKSLATYDGEDRVVSARELASELKNMAGKERQIVFGPMFSLLTVRTGGCYTGELHVVSGYTGQGKTLLCQSLTRHISDIHGVLWFSYEVNPRQFLHQVSDKGVPPNAVFMPLLLKSGHPDWIKDRIIEAKIKYNCDTVFIDHLHYLADLMVSRNPSLEIGAIVRRIKQLALELDVCIFLIAHTTKIKADKSEEIGLGSVRDSSFIEQEADGVYYVWRREKSPNKAVLKIAKNRRIGTMNAKIYLEKDGKFLREDKDANSTV